MDPLSPAVSDNDIRSLVAGVLAADARAIDGWYRCEHPEVHRLCFGFLADAAEAEDLTQDAMLHLHDRLGSWSPVRPYRSWRNTVVLNLCRDRLRRIEARARAHERAAKNVLERGDPAPDPSSALERDEVQELLRETLEQLTPRERETFVLRELEGHSSEETAEMLGVGVSSVRSLLSLARRRLRGLLAHRMPELAGGGERG